MKDSNRTDERIRELFSAAREADMAATPDFHEILDRKRTAGRGSAIRRGPRLALCLASATCLSAIALASVWWLAAVPRHHAPLQVAVNRPATPPAPPPSAPPVSVSEAPSPPVPAVAVPEAAAPPTEEPPPVVEPAHDAPAELSRELIEQLYALGYIGGPDPPGAPVPTRSSAPVKTKRVPSAGSATGGITVVVSDPEGLPLPGATVTISNELGYVKATADVADRRGVVTFPVLRSGPGYSIEASFPGFSPLRFEAIQVVAYNVSPLRVQMVEEFQESVKLVTLTDTIDLDATDTRTRFSDDVISDLPVPGRFYQDVLTVAPGADDPDGDGNPNVHGSRSSDFQAVVGNVQNVDPLTGQWLHRIATNTVEEMEVVSAGAGVEFGRAQGGFARIVADGEVVPVPDLQRHRADFNTEDYDRIEENEFLAAILNPLSTFSIDVDTASYANVRRFLRAEQRPPADAVRIEELINYFDYDYAEPIDGVPFAVHADVADCPWNDGHQLVRIGLKGREITRAETVGSNLVFLIDVSGSMDYPNKLPLLKKSLHMLVRQLNGRDQVAMVVYAGNSGLVLPSTSGNDKKTILHALRRLSAGGSTNGGSGLRLAYKVARENFIPGGINRVILATDGDFNIGVTSRSELLSFIEKDAREGIFLTVLGFGMGNYQDGMLEMLTGKGNGNYAYIDTEAEARKVLVDQISGTLLTIAKDVKIQVEFNPQEVGGYRLIGYENRVMAKEDFNDDRKDAGEIGAGHTVTALYEIVPVEKWNSEAPVDALKYQSEIRTTEAAGTGELLTVKLRYKKPDEHTSAKIEVAVAAECRPFETASDDFKFAAAVAGFGMLLRDSEHCGDATLQQMRRIGLESLEADPNGYRGEFLDLVSRAIGIVGDGE